MLVTGVNIQTQDNLFVPVQDKSRICYCYGRPWARVATLLLKVATVPALRMSGESEFQAGTGRGGGEE